MNDITFMSLQNRELGSALSISGGNVLLKNVVFANNDELLSVSLPIIDFQLNGLKKFLIVNLLFCQLIISQDATADISITGGGVVTCGPSITFCDGYSGIFTNGDSNATNCFEAGEIGIPGIGVCSSII
jgi:hypothetical protein